MPTLRITVEWLDGTYHGREWPPSPFRLYQAMLAGYAVHQRGNPVLEAAMRHLETLPAPAITAPHAHTQPAVTASVPNNDGDQVLALLAVGKAHSARKKSAKSVTLRTRRAWRFDGATTYDWRATPTTTEHFPALETIAACVSAVGLGIDAVVAHAALIERPAEARGVRYLPSPSGRRMLNVPYCGAFEDLEERYRALRRRIANGTIAAVRELPPQLSGYVSELDLPSLRCAAFALRSPDDRPLAVEGMRAMEVAAMVRHAINSVARRARLDETTVSDLMGHGSEGKRIRTHPLPNVGHRYADGCIRRVMLTASEEVDEEIWADVVSRLIGESLMCIEDKRSVGLLAPLTSPDPITDRFRGEATHWTTATPVVLPGHDHRRGQARPERRVRRLLRHAQIPEALVESVAMEAAARLPGSEPPARYHRPRHLARYPCQHMSIRWRSPVKGPLALGAGTGYGLGLFMPAPARS